jgi:hypothetical protein
VVEPEAVRAFPVVIARRILTGNANQVLAKSQDGVFVSVEGLRQARCNSMSISLLMLA